MIVENIKKIDGLHLGLFLENIQSAPIHMHNAYEIIYVLRGHANLKCTAFQYYLSPGDVFIVNVKELHSFSKGSPDNIIFTLHLEPYEYLNIFPKLNFYLFVCDSFSSEKKDSVVLKKLQQVLSKIFMLLQQENQEDSNIDQVEEYILSLITLLINNFQSFYVKQKGYYNNPTLKNTDFQLERLAEMQEYIYVHANEKITLEDISNYLHLNKYYVSHLIKNTIGLTLTDFVNLTRVEQSELLLLSTNMSVEQIAFECGFSAKRYYEKNFLKWFHFSPSEYKKQMLTVQEWEHRQILQGDPDYTAAWQILDVNISTSSKQAKFSEGLNYALDLKTTPHSFPHRWDKPFIISKPFLSAHLFTESLLKNLKDDLNLQTLKIYHLFSQSNRSEPLWDCAYEDYGYSGITSFFDRAINFSISLQINIEIAEIDNAQIKKDLNRFLDFYMHRYGHKTVSQWSFEIDDTTRTYTKNKKNTQLANEIKKIIFSFHPQFAINTDILILPKANYSYNSVFSLPNIINEALSSSHPCVEEYREVFDIAENPNNPSLVSREKNNAILSNLGEKKPTYYIWELLSKSGDHILAFEKGMLCTKKGENIIILLYDSIHTLKDSSTKKKRDPLNFFIQLKNIEYDYIITKIYLDSENSLFHHLTTMKFPPKLSKEEIDYINLATRPSISFAHMNKKKEDCKLSMQINPYSAMLLVLAPKS